MVGNSGIKTSALVFAIFLISTGLALWAASGEALWHQLSLLGLAQFAVLLGLSLVNYGMRALRWQMFTHVLGARTGLLQMLRHYIGGFALTMTPARLGEVIRIRWVARETGIAAEALTPLILVDRAGDLASTGLLLGFALAMGTGGISGGLPVALLAIIAALVATRPVLFSGLVNISYRLIGRKPRLFARMRRAARSLQSFSRPRIILSALLIGASGWLAEGVAFHLLLGWMGAGLPLWTSVSIFLFAMMTGGATGMPGGVGGAEAALVALLTLEGVPLETSLPATAIIRITSLWFAIGLGIVVFPFAEGISSRTGHALENR